MTATVDSAPLPASAPGHGAPTLARAAISACIPLKGWANVTCRTGPRQPPGRAPPRASLGPLRSA
jgi:hypothetical protein